MNGGPIQSHPDEATLQRFREALLASSEQTQVAAHVDGCPACARAVDAYARLEGALKQLPRVEVPAALTDAVIARVLESLAEQSHRRVEESGMVRARLWALAGALVAAAVAVILLAGPHLASPADTLALLGELVSSGFSVVRVVLAVGRGLIQVLEPLRDMALVLGSTGLALAAVLLNRRLTPDLTLQE